MYDYKCKVVRVVDGDTVDIDIDLGFGVWLHKERVRVMGIDTPESRTRDKVEKRFGLLAKEFVEKFLQTGDVILTTKKYDAKGKFGRILGDFVCNGRTLSKVMIEEYHAVEYHGQSKEDIREAHLANRRKVKII
tara:strand:+ start:889 stop:1290 length:402 start_codon:yes stop_codon:yes gene_type:complete